MFVKHLLALPLKQNPFYIQRYISFISSRKGEKIKYKTHFHHILPKSKTFFPQFKNLKENPWNGIHLTAREHLIAHRMLHKAFPGSSQSIAFFNMSNITGKKNSRAYQEARDVHIEAVIKMTQDPKRNKKISDALSGVPKSAAHIAKLLGHEVTTATREKLRDKNTGKKASDKARAKMVKTRTGQKRGKYKEGTGENISKSILALDRKWFNNGVTSKFCSVAPDNSWIRGRLPWKELISF